MRPAHKVPEVIKQNVILSSQHTCELRVIFFFSLVSFCYFSLEDDMCACMFVVLDPTFHISHPFHMYVIDDLHAVFWFWALCICATLAAKCFGNLPSHYDRVRYRAIYLSLGALRSTLCALPLIFRALFFQTISYSVLLPRTFSTFTCEQQKIEMN